jgi:hypothetical protein
MGGWSSEADVISGTARIIVTARTEIFSRKALLPVNLAVGAWCWRKAARGF